MGAFCMKYGRDHAKGPIRKGGEEPRREKDWERAREMARFSPCAAAERMVRFDRNLGGGGMKAKNSKIRAI